MHLATHHGELTADRDFDVYAAGMDAGLDLKLHDLEFAWQRLPAGAHLADLGCGTGALLARLRARRPDLALSGVDLSPALLLRAHEAVPDAQLHQGGLHPLPYSPGTLDAVVLSSVLHEVYSYGGYDRGAVDQVLTGAGDALATGGRLALRDGVAPDRGDRPVWLHVTGDALAARLHAFADDFRPAHRSPGIALDDRGAGWFRLRLHDACEFASKAWYVDNWDSEVQEEFGVHTLAGWRDAVTRAGFTVEHAAAYPHPWTVAHRWDGALAFHHDDRGRPGARMRWPDTTAVVHAVRR